MKPDDMGTERPFLSIWQQALAGNQNAQTAWRAERGSQWKWGPDGLKVVQARQEWSVIGCQRFDQNFFDGLTNFVIEVTVDGEAGAAGLSFGDFKDFLGPPLISGKSQRLRLEVNTSTGLWAFYINGKLQRRHWWNGSVATTQDITSGLLSMKTRHARHVVFRDFMIRTYAAECRLSIIITCNRFLQRLRVSLHNWCHQEIPPGTFELLIVNPNSPDGTHDYLTAVAQSYSHIRLHEIQMNSKSSKNKGRMINEAARASQGEWVWLTDADCIFPINSASLVLNHVNQRQNRIYFGQRYHLSTPQTYDLITGRCDSVKDFDQVKQQAPPRAPEIEPWGYTQIVHHSTLKKIPYREGINHFAHSDDIFVKDCQRQQIRLEQIDGLFCLHLAHPFAWNGTTLFL